MNTIQCLSSDKDVNFTGEIIQNAIENESLSLPADMGLNKINQFIIKSIVLQADQNLAWDLILWSKSSYSNTDLDIDSALDVVSFTAASGKQIAASGQYYYNYPLSYGIAYRDNSNSSKIHCGLINRSATSKNAGATGEVKITFILEVC